MIKVIWSDDIFESTTKMQTSIEFAYSHDIVLIPKQTWEETQKELELAGDTFDAIILDGMGQKTIDSKTNDKSHLTQAISWISEQKGKGKSYPTIIYTGFYDDVNELYEGDKGILAIIKKPQIHEVYRKIKEAVENAPNLKIKQKYSDVWKIFNNEILDSSVENKLLGLIQKEEIGCFEKNDFNTIREIFENLLKKFNTLSLLPDDVIKPNGTINLEWSLRILKGEKTDIKIGETIIRTILWNNNPTIPNKHHIGYCFHFVKETSSALSHEYPAGYGRTTSTACLNALLEILNWSNKLIIQRNLL